jgi:phytoene dehydrogenase-like protein
MDAIVVGSGPNGLAAAVELQRSGAKVLVLEAADEIGGGTRTEELTLPGFRHDVCSGAHPMGILSPYYSALPLGEHGLEWLKPRASIAHPLDDGPAVLAWADLREAARELDDDDAPRYEELLAPFLPRARGLLEDTLGPIARFPRHPLLMMRFGLAALRSATGLARGRFAGTRARALFAGCGAHSILPLERLLSGGVGLIFLITAHVEPWPVARGGSASIARALASYLKSLGGEIRTGVRVRTLSDLPPARVALFDTNPGQLAEIARPALPDRYLEKLRRYRYGPGVYKLDWALDGPIPWKDPRCLEASTVHLGGTLDEIAAGEAAVWRGEHPERPFVLVVQQSQLDPSRAPAGKHTGYAYCHVPVGSTMDMTEKVEAQLERFAPGFKDRVLARHGMNCADFERHNPNFVGGAITGGVADLFQAFARPTSWWDPYATPNPRLYLCSASTPPGGGVHGMCGYHAARRALKRMARTEEAPF